MTPGNLFCNATLAVALLAWSGCSPRRPPASTAPAAEPLMVLVYNIHAGTDADGAPNLDRVAEVIESSRADVVLLQEVDRGTRRSGGVDQVAELERLTWMHGAFGRTLDYDGGEYGIAVLSRWPILSDTVIRLPVDPPQERAGGAHEPRGALRVVLDAPGRRVGVLNTHLDASAVDRYRRQEVATVRRLADALRSEHPITIVGGDFNAEPGTATIAALDDEWVDAWSSCGDGPGATFAAGEPAKRIDYLFIPPETACLRAMVPATEASDHRPVLVAVAAGPVAVPAPVPPLSPDARRWVDETLASLSLGEKAGQLVMPWIGGEYVAVDSPEFDQLLEWVETYGIGGLVVSVGLPHSYAAKLNEIQTRARVPLLVASDMEAGPGTRLGGIYSFPHLLPQGGGTTFPPVMALGAARSPRLAYELGRVVGREARAVGVHLNFGPVLDVNSNPANPVINTRSFGEDPATVAALGTAYIRGAHAAGLMTTAKHFPGHGDTSEDSHLALPVIAADRDRMDAVELPPFAAAIDAGVDAVMTAHIAVRGVLGPAAPPATLSPYFMTEVLRDELRFDGLLFTDAMDMGGVASEYGGGAEVLIRALEAGADVLLMPTDVGAAVDAVVGAVESGRLPEARIDASVRRLLEAKARTGLHRSRTVDLEAVDEIVGIRAHTEVAREVAERSLTLVRDRAGLVPLPDSARVLVVSYAMPTDPVAGRTFRALLGAARPMDVARVDARTTPEEWDRLRVRADSFDLVLAAIHDAPPVSDDSVATDPGFPAFVDSLAAGGTPVLGVSFGSPYVLQAFPSLPTYLVAWSGVDVSQRAAARALLGEIPIAGRLPVSVPPDYEAGHGIRRKAAPNARAPSHSRGGPPDAAAPEAAPRRDER